MANDTYTLIISDTGISIPASDSVSSTILQDNAVITAKILDNNVTLPKLAQAGANTVLGNGTGSTANITALATTGTGNVVRATGATLVAPVLGTPAVGSILTNCTGLVLSTGVTGVLPVANGGTGMATHTAGIVVANGTSNFSTVAVPAGSLVGTSATQTLTNKTLSSPTLNSPTLVTPALGTPVSGDLSNCTGFPIGSTNLATGVTGILPVANGGTNASTAAAARTNLGIPTIISGTAAVADFSLGQVTVSISGVTATSKVFVVSTYNSTPTNGLSAYASAGTITIHSSASPPIADVNYLIIV